MTLMRASAPALLPVPSGSPVTGGEAKSAISSTRPGAGEVAGRVARWARVTGMAREASASTSAAASEPPRREYFIVGRPLLLHVRVRIRHGEPPRFQPARPVAEIVLRDAHHLHWRDDRWYVLFQVHFFEDALDRDVAPVVGRQGQQHRRQSILDEGELRRQAT